MADLATESELVCSKCEHYPCTCSPKVPPSVTVQGVCVRCKRDSLRCLCVSHVPIKAEALEDPPEPKPVKKHDAKSIERVVQEAMACYYGLDAEGLARLIRRVLKERDQ